ncbi:MAG: hypothetical protein ACOC80_07875 [Petrotogales bacterium]
MADENLEKELYDTLIRFQTDTKDLEKLGKSLGGVTSKERGLVAGSKKVGRSLRDLGRVVRGVSGDFRTLAGLAGAGFGLSHSMGYLEKYSKAMISLSAQATKYGIGTKDLEKRMKSLSDELNITRQATMDLFSEYEKGFPIASLSNAEKIFKNIRNMVGANEDAMKGILGTIKGTVSEYVGLQNSVANLTKADKERLRNHIKSRVMMGEMNLEQAKALTDYIVQNKQVNKEQEQALERHQRYIDTVQSIKKSFEEFAIVVGRQIAPVLKDVADYLKEHMDDIKGIIKWVGKWAKEIGTVFLAYKGLQIVSGLYQGGKGLVGGLGGMLGGMKGGGIGKIMRVGGKAVVGGGAAVGGIWAGKNLGGMIGGAVGGEGGEKTGGILGSAGGGAVGGAIAGSMIAPGIGTAIGGIVGGIGGLVYGIIDNAAKEQKKAMEEMERDYDKAMQKAAQEYTDSVRRLDKYFSAGKITAGQKYNMNMGAEIKKDIEETRQDIKKVRLALEATRKHDEMSGEWAGGEETRRLEKSLSEKMKHISGMERALTSRLTDYYRDVVVHGRGFRRELGERTQIQSDMYAESPIKGEETYRKRKEEIESRRREMENKFLANTGVTLSHHEKMDTSSKKYQNIMSNQENVVLVDEYRRISAERNELEQRHNEILNIRQKRLEATSKLYSNQLSYIGALAEQAKVLGVTEGRREEISKTVEQSLERRRNLLEDLRTKQENLQKDIETAEKRIRENRERLGGNDILSKEELKSYDKAKKEHEKLLKDIEKDRKEAPPIASFVGFGSDIESDAGRKELEKKEQRLYELEDQMQGYSEERVKMSREILASEAEVNQKKAENVAIEEQIVSLRQKAVESLLTEYNLLKDMASAQANLAQSATGYAQSLLQYQQITNNLNTGELKNAIGAGVEELKWERVAHKKVVGEIDSLLGRRGLAGQGEDRFVNMAMARRKVNKMGQDEKGKLAKDLIGVMEKEGMIDKKQAKRLRERKDANKIILEIMSQRNKSLSDSLDVTKKIHDIEMLTGNEYDLQLKKATSITGIMKQQVAIADRLGMGLGASVKMRQTVLDNLRKEYMYRQKNIANLEESLKKVAKEDERLDIENKILGLRQQQMSNLQQQADTSKAIRSGWISTINSMTVATGRVSKIMLTKEQGLRTALEVGATVSNISGSITPGAGGAKSARFSTFGGQFGVQGPANMYKVYGMTEEELNSIKNNTGDMKDILNNMQKWFKRGVAGAGIGSAQASGSKGFETYTDPKTGAEVTIGGGKNGGESAGKGARGDRGGTGIAGPAGEVATNRERTKKTGNQLTSNMTIIVTSKSELTEALKKQAGKLSKDNVFA